MGVAEIETQKLAILGGPKAVTAVEEELFHWPIITKEDEQAILEVLHAGTMSETDITKKFEAEWAEYIGTKYALAHSSGTMSLLVAMFAVGLGRGDEIISPSMTFWATALQAQLLGATPVFADIELSNHSIDPNDIEHRITDRTKAIIIVHYGSNLCDMDPIMAIAEKHNLKVIEDVSHAQGNLYKGRMAGSIGHISAMSMMARKSFAIGEAGMLCTNDREMYERAVAFAHVERVQDVLTLPYLKQAATNDNFALALPQSGLKARLTQFSSAMGRVQLKYYPERIKEIDKAMNRFCDLIEGTPGLHPMRPEKGSGSFKGGWYAASLNYAPEELGGLAASKFREALKAEGCQISSGCNLPMHLHPMLNTVDVYGDGKPTRIAFSDRDVRKGQGLGAFPVSEALPQRCLGLPKFKHDWPESIECYAAAYRKVAANADQLL